MLSFIHLLCLQATQFNQNTNAKPSSNYPSSSPTHYPPSPLPMGVIIHHSTVTTRTAQFSSSWIHGDPRIQFSPLPEGQAPTILLVTTLLSSSQTDPASSCTMDTISITVARMLHFAFSRGRWLTDALEGLRRIEFMKADLHARSPFCVEFPHFVSNLLREEPVGALLFVPQHFGLPVSAALAVVARALAHVWYQACIISLYI